jgi:hypothetical protein
MSALTDKPQFDAAWEPWIGANPAHWPQRVCVGVALSGGLRLELAAVALRSATGNEAQISQRSLMEFQPSRIISIRPRRFSRWGETVCTTVVRGSQYHCDNNEVAESSVFRHKE